MDILQRYGISKQQLGIGVITAVIVIIIVALAIRISNHSTYQIRSNAPSSSYEYGLVEPKIAYDDAMNDTATLSVRNVMDGDLVEENNYTAGQTAEDFEVTQYSVQYQVSDDAAICQTLLDLKSRDAVIFEQQETYDHGCSFEFKVTRDTVADVLVILEQLDPREISQSTQTIKQALDDYTSREEILQQKLASIDQTMESALEAYDDITQVARQSNDAASLASIIDSKVRIIERLTEQRIMTVTQLEQLQRAHSLQLDRLEYTYFYVHVVEHKYIDGRQLVDSWKSAIRTAVRDINLVFQDITISLAVVILQLLQYLIYGLLLLILAKYGYRFVVGFWKR